MISGATLSFLTTIVQFVLGFAVLMRNPKGEAHRLFFAFVSCIALWGFADFGIRLSGNADAADLIHKIGAAGFCLFPAVYLHFIFFYTGFGSFMRRAISHVVLYGVALALIMLHTMGFITSVALSPDGGFSVEHAGGYDAYVAWVVLCSLSSAALIVQRARVLPAGKERRLLVIQIGTLGIIVALSLILDAAIPFYGFRPLLTGGLSSLTVVGVFAVAMLRGQDLVLSPESVAERVLDTTGDLVCVLAPDGTLSYATDLFRRALHFDPFERIEDIHVRDILQEADEVLALAVSDVPGTFSREVHFQTRTGTLLPVLLSVARVTDHSRPSGLVLVGHDLSERQELTQRYQETLEKYQHIVESSLDGIVVVQEGGLVFVNPSAVRIFGYASHEEMIGTSFDDTVAPSSKPFMFGDFKQKKIGEDIFRNYEMKGLTKEGRIIDLEISAKLIIWNGKPGVQASFRDITERKNLEKEQALWFWEQESLRGIDRQLAAMVELENVLDTVTRNARAFSRADFSGVILIEDSRMYRWRGVKGNRNEVEDRYYLLKGSHKILFEAPKPVLIEDFGVNEIFPPEDFPVLSSEHILTVAAFPFRIKENHEGVLVIGFRTRRRLSERENRLLSSLADKAALALANAELYEELRDREQELERLADLRVEAQEDERRRIAREIHDGLGQMLSAIKFNVEVLEDVEGLNERDRKKLIEVKELLDNVMTEAREISYNLMPSVLEDFGLKPALQLLCESFGKRMNVPTSFHAHGVDGRLHHALEINLYRIVQEALNNISKHAKAASVEIQLIRDDRGVRLTIEDDGKGFVRHAVPKRAGEKSGMGLISMRQRALSFGGTLIIESSPGKGTSIIVDIPRPQELLNETDQNTAGG